MLIFNDLVMKRFLFSIICFIICFIIIDISFGILMKKIRNYSLESNKIDYVIDKCNAEVLIMGSSKAAEHYIPSIISDSLSCTVYNCGMPGNGIIGAYLFLQLMKNKPSFIVYEVTPGYDYFMTEPYIKYLNAFKHLYGRSPVNEMYEKCIPEEILKLKCNLYKYNNRIEYIKSVFIDNNTALKNLGYIPLSGDLDTALICQTNEHVAYQEFDSIKANYFRAFVEYCETEGISIIFVISPRYVNDVDKNYDYAKRICESYNIKYFDNRVLTSISDKPELYHDQMHLNADGAKQYSQYFAHQIKDLYLQSQQ